MRALFLALNAAGTGETAFGVQLARQVRERGGVASFLAHSFVATHLRAEFPTVELTDGTAPLVELAAQQLIARERPDVLVLCDLYTCASFARQTSSSFRFLKPKHVPTVGIDTWNIREAPNRIDTFDGRSASSPGHSLGPKVERLLPVPLIRPDFDARTCSFLPRASVRLSTRGRNEARRALGIPGDGQLILLCTAQWQHARYANAHGRRISRSVPRLLAQYLRPMTSARLLHIGPRSLRLDDVLGERYMWMPPVGAADFTKILDASDLVLTANVTGTTVFRAIAQRKPVLAVTNSAFGDSAEEVWASLAVRPTPVTRCWVREQLPLYRFVMWPLGFYAFLSPVLKNNPYFEALECVELLDHERFQAKYQALLTRKDEARRLAERQERYCATVDRLPLPIDLLEQQVRRA